ncbi:MAG: DNA/RNA non-specific endonuclease [Bacteroidales bacterium]|nr:DNA/RNA non-specific endonuclease [Bacteroidales bacterium]
MKKKLLSISGVLIILVIALFSVFAKQGGQQDVKHGFYTQNDDEIPEEYIEISNNCRYTGINLSDKKLLTIENLLPEGKMSLDKYDHRYFVLGYSNKHKQSGYCAWILTKYMVRNKNVKRENLFREDTSLKCCMSYNSDYNRSGYDRGHLCPSGDMTWDKNANRETFLLSNICPQHKKLNQGRWNDLEILSRAWAGKNDSLLIITGPVLEPNKGTIGKGKVTVPSAFYKILIDISSPKCKAIAFIMDNEPVKQRLFTYAVSIKEVERRTGLNFFPEYDKNSLIQSLERMCDTTDWK